MPPVGTIIGLAVIVGLIWLLFRAASKSAAEQKQLQRECVPAKATILAVGSSRHDSQTKETLVDLRLRVEVDGQEPREVSTTWYVMPASVPSFQKGAVVKVGVHPKEPLLVMPRAQGADFSWFDYLQARKAAAQSR